MEIVDQRSDGAVVRLYTMLLDKAGYKRHKSKKTKCWDLLVRWENDTSSWEHIKELK